ncbi:carboxymuconolactone decarboxylase family protein [Psychromonas sp. 14N.309.X.WAT.B.A12]|nr:carboxymuconolactone decarboxylase family protein [Psychromonas sp. 14N.309.X.WAT.B.A12]MDN2662512.1 carboxymuconolactone decarboxylase family protein [Psychromonas sp. 14N.309.X.WAT.B.A12]
MLALKEVVAEREQEGKLDEVGVSRPSSVPEGASRYALGVQSLSQLDENQVENLEATFEDISPDLARLVIEYGFADIFSRPALDIQHREMATLAALTAMGTASAQLKFHIKAALHIGVSQIEIREIIILMSVYCGFPAAINGTLVLKEVMSESSSS